MTILLQGWQHYPLQVPIKRPQLALPFVHSKIISHEGETENCTAGNKKKKKPLASATEVCTCTSDDQQFRCAHVLLGLGPGKIKFGDLSLPFFMQQEAFLRCCKDQSPASARTSRNHF